MAEWYFLSEYGQTVCHEGLLLHSNVGNALNKGLLSYCLRQDVVTVLITLQTTPKKSFLHPRWLIKVSHDRGFSIKLSSAHLMLFHVSSMMAQRRPWSIAPAENHRM